MRQTRNLSKLEKDPQGHGTTTPMYCYVGPCSLALLSVAAASVLDLREPRHALLPDMASAAQQPNQQQQPHHAKEHISNLLGVEPVSSGWREQLADRADGFEPYAANGGSCIAVAGRDYVIIAADTRLSSGDSILSRNLSRLKKFDASIVMAVAGCWAVRQRGYRAVPCCPCYKQTAVRDD